MAELHSLTLPLVSSFIARMIVQPEDAEEVTLDVYQQIWMSCRTFNPEKSSAINWILLLAHSRATDRIRAEIRRTRTLEAWSRDSKPQCVIDPERQVENRLLLRFVLRLINSLPDDQKHAVKLAYLEEKTHREMSAVLAAPLGTVKTRVRLGLTKLRRSFQPTLEMHAERGIRSQIAFGRHDNVVL
jgi:RNA polymerase sigma-70 factor (ECF subfamily)